LDQLNTLIDISKNRINYRNYFKSLKIGKYPVLPHLGLILSDVVFMDAGNPNSKIIDNYKYLNFNKR
jgi:hypothetical protein